MRDFLRRLVGLLAVAATSAATSGSAQTDPVGVQPTFKMDYYEVVGAKWHDIWTSIQTNLQHERDLQGRFEGVTSYSITLGPQNLVDSGTCSAATATLSVDLTVKVPQLTTRNLDPQDQECWAFYDRSLSDHEEWHVQIAVHDANALLEKIRSNPNASCREIGQLVTQEFQKMKAEQDAYDLETLHGVEQWRAYGLDAPKESSYSAGVRNRCFG